MSTDAELIPVGAPGTAPRSKTSRRRVVYRESAWRVHELAVSTGGERAARVAVLSMPGSLLLWAGAERALGEVAVAVPGDNGAGALATAVLGGGEAAEGWAAALARRLATARARPAWAAGGAGLGRFGTPLLARALQEEMRAHPECF